MTDRLFSSSWSAVWDNQIRRAVAEVEGLDRSLFSEPALGGVLRKIVERHTVDVARLSTDPAAIVADAFEETREIDDYGLQRSVRVPRLRVTIPFTGEAETLSVLLTACAKDASEVGATYVSPVLYENYTCPQLAEEAQRVSSRAAQASGVQDQRATNDKVAMGVGLIVFWPVMLMTKGNDENTAELARLKGQMDAIEEASIKKRCNITFQKPTQQTSASAQATQQPNTQ